MRMQGLMVLAALVATLSGCAVNKAYDSDPDEFSSVPETHGVVVFQVANMEQSLNRYMRDWTAFRARRIGGGPMTWLEEGENPPQQYIVSPDYRQIPGTTLWVGLLPAGTYLAEDLYSYFFDGNLHAQLSAPIADRFASFRIEPGRVTLLDSYLYTGFDTNFLLFNIAAMDDLLAAARDAYPKVLSTIDMSKPLRFPDSVRTESEDSFDTIARWAETMGMATYAPDDRIYRPSKAGQIFERLQDGTWQRIALDTLEAVDAVWAAGNGEAIAVTAGGKLYHRVSADENFRERSLSLTGRLRRLERLADGTWVATVLQTEVKTVVETYQMHKERTVEKEFYTLEIYRSKDYREGEWKRVAGIPVSRHFSRTMVVDNSMVTYSPGENSVEIDFEDDSNYDLPGNFMYLRQYDDGRMLATTEFDRGFWSGDAVADLWIYRPETKAWQKLPSVKPRGMPEFMDDGSILLAGERTFRTRAERYTSQDPFMGLLRLRPGSDVWDAYEKLPDNCSGWVELKQLDDGLLLLCEYRGFYRENEEDPWLPEDMRDLSTGGEKVREVQAAMRQ